MNFEFKNKKRKLHPNLIIRWLKLQPFVFESSLPAEECARRLQKLSDKHAYVRARRGKITAAVAVTTQIRELKKGFEFEIREERGREIRGILYFHPVYETTVVKGKWRGGTVLGLLGLVCSSVIFLGVSMDTISSGDAGKLVRVIIMALMLIIPWGFLVFTKSDSDDYHELIEFVRNMLTEPDESKL